MPLHLCTDTASKHLVKESGTFHLVKNVLLSSAEIRCLVDKIPWETASAYITPTAFAAEMKGKNPNATWRGWRYRTAYTSGYAIEAYYDEGNIISYSRFNIGGVAIAVPARYTTVSRVKFDLVINAWKENVTLANTALRIIVLPIDWLPSSSFVDYPTMPLTGDPTFSWLEGFQHTDYVIQESDCHAAQTWTTRILSIDLDPAITPGNNHGIALIAYIKDFKFPEATDSSARGSFGIDLHFADVSVG